MIKALTLIIPSVDELVQRDHAELNSGKIFLNTRRKLSTYLHSSGGVQLLAVCYIPAFSNSVSLIGE